MLSAGISNVWVNVVYFLLFVFLLQVYFVCRSIKFLCFQSGPVKKAQKIVTQYSHIFFVSVRNFKLYSLTM
jgi:hypothetical protein